MKPTLIPIGNQKDLEMLAKIKQWHSDACADLLNLSMDTLKPLIAKTNAFNSIYLEFSNRLISSGGNAKTTQTTQYGKIALNYRLFKSTGTDADLKNTYLHELAHVLANRLFKTQCGHNSDWRIIARKLGCTAERCHKMEVNHLRPYHTKRTYEVYCACKTHMVTKSKWNKINVISSRFTCPNCKGEVTCQKES